MDLAHVVLSNANPKKKPNIFLHSSGKKIQRELGPSFTHEPIFHTVTEARKMKDELARPGHSGLLLPGTGLCCISPRKAVLPERGGKGKFAKTLAPQPLYFSVTGWLL